MEKSKHFESIFRFISRREWIFLAPVVAACLVAFLRFPLLQNDDHLSVVRYIADQKAWPPVSGELGSQTKHVLVHHTIAACIYRGVELLDGAIPLKPERGVQLLSLLWAMGTIPLIWILTRQLIEDKRARILSFLIFGTFTYWIVSAVTIDNDMAMSFWGNAALLQAVILMKSSRLPSYRKISIFGLLIGIAALMKDTASIMIIPAVMSILSRNRLYKEPVRALICRTLILIAVWGALASLNYIRHYRDTGHLFSHVYLQDDASVKFTERWDYLSFRYPEILKRPFKRNPERGDTRWNSADASFLSKLYLSWWNLPDYLPALPDPEATRGLYLTALPISLCGIFGIFLAMTRIKKQPAWFPVVSWVLIGLVVMFIGTFTFPNLRCSSLLKPRYISYAAGSQVVLLAFVFQEIIRHLPVFRGIIICLVFIQLIAFWWLLLSGPFYSFITPWPCLTSP